VLEYVIKSLSAANQSKEGGISYIPVSKSKKKIKKLQAAQIQLLQRHRGMCLRQPPMQIAKLNKVIEIAMKGEMADPAQ